MPRFWRSFSGPRVITSGHVTKGPASPGQQVCTGRKDRSTSCSLITTSWQGADLRTVGAMFSTCFQVGRFSQRSRQPLGGVGSFRNAISLPTSRSPCTSCCPIANAMRRVLPNRLPSNGTLEPIGFSNSRAGPPARSVRSQISVISRLGSTGTEMRFNSPSASSSAINSRRSLNDISGFPFIHRTAIVNHCWIFSAQSNVCAWPFVVRF